MATGFSPALPISINDVDGHYRLNKDISSLTAQNMKMIILTIPGERIMNPDFGVGIVRYVFEQNTPSLKMIIYEKIREQVEKYMPYVALSNIFISDFDSDPGILKIEIKYDIGNIILDETLNIIASGGGI